MGVLYAVGLQNESGTIPTEPASVVNLSLGQEGQPSDPFLYEAIGDAVDTGATVLAAAGNDGKPALFYPAMYDNTIAVGALTNAGQPASYSNTGQELDFTAPGGTASEGVWSTWDYPCDDPLDLFSGPIDGCSPGAFVNLYATQAGTSMATPHVAGVVALLYSYAPELTQDLVYDILLASAEDAGDPGHDQEYGHGIVNARAALEYLIQATDDFAVAPVGSAAGAGGGADAGAGDTATATGTQASSDGPRGRPLPNREGAFVPAATASAGVDYDATTVLFSLREGRLSPVELDQARARIVSEVSGVTAVAGSDPRRMRGTLSAGEQPDIVIQELADHPEVRFAQPNYLYTVPALYPRR
jgi:subtilisin family serine protease